MTRPPGYFSRQSKIGIDHLATADRLAAAIRSGKIDPMKSTTNVEQGLCRWIVDFLRETEYEDPTVIVSVAMQACHWIVEMGMRMAGHERVSYPPPPPDWRYSPGPAIYDPAFVPMRASSKCVARRFESSLSDLLIARFPNASLLPEWRGVCLKRRFPDVKLTAGLKAELAGLVAAEMAKPCVACVPA